MAGGEREWTLLSWNGVGFEIPADWSLAAAGGDRKRGSLRVEDDYTVRAEVVWQPIHKKRTLDHAVEEVRKRFLRTARKRREDVAIEDVTDLKLKRKAYHVVRCLSQREEGPVESLNLVYRCEPCRRAVVATVLFRPGERKPMTEIARHLFDTLQDHASGDRDVWSAYGVRLEVPTDFELASSSLRVGLVDLSFVRRDWQIDFVRSAMADVQIRREGLGKWFAHFYAKRLRRYATTTRRTEFRGHAAVAVEGRTKISKSLMRPLRPRDRIYARAWHCQQTDKLFIVRLSAPADASEEFQDLLEHALCH